MRPRSYRQASRNFVALPAIAIFLFALADTQPAQADAFASNQMYSKCNGSIQNSPLNGNNSGPLSAISDGGVFAGTCISNPFEASASASAGLAAGNLTISASGAFVLGELHVSVIGTGPVTANALARIQDTLTIIPTSGFSDGGFDVTLTLVTTGTLSGDAFAGGGLSAGSAVQSSNFPVPALCTAPGALCAAAGVPTVPSGAQTQTITVTLAVPTSFPAVFLTASLFANDNNIGSFLDVQDGSAVFSDTAIFSIMLPVGFTFTSASGAVGLLNSVPEAATLALFTFGLAGLGFMRRRRTA